MRSFTTYTELNPKAEEMMQDVAHSIFDESKGANSPLNVEPDLGNQHILLPARTYTRR
jgi:hypothetical protein